MPIFAPFSYYEQKDVAVVPGIQYYTRYDGYSGSLRLAIPGSEFDGLITDGFDDIHADIKGTGTNIQYALTGSASEINLDTTDIKWASEGYGSSVFAQDAGQWGTATEAELSWGSNSWVVEGWVYMDERFTKPPYWKVAVRHTNYNIDCDFGFPSTGTTNGRMRIVLDTSSTGQTQYVTGNFAYNLNQWYHVAWVRSGNTLNMYFDGTRQYSSTPSIGSVDTNGSYHRIMRGENTTNDGAAGNYQDLRVYIGTDKGYTGTTITPPASIVTTQQQDDDAGAFLQAANIQDSTQQNAVNQLVLDLKDAGLWTKLYAIYPFVGGTASTHKWNLKDPRDLNAAYRLTFNGTVTHSSGGVKSNGTNGYYNTNMPHNTMGQNDASMFVYIRDNIAEGKVDMGILDTASPYTGFQINARDTSNVITARCNSQTLSTVANTDARGLIGISRTSSSSYSISKDTTQTSQSVASTGTKTRQIFGLCFNLNGNPGFYSTRQQAFASLGQGLSDAEIDSYYTIVQAYQTTLGREI